MCSAGQAKRSIIMKCHQHLHDPHITFVLHSNVDFYLKFNEYSKFNFFLTALLAAIHDASIDTLCVVVLFFTNMQGGGGGHFILSLLTSCLSSCILLEH